MANIGRPSNSEKAEKMYLREQFQAMNACLNSLEQICKSPNLTQKEDLIGTIGLQVGKLQIRADNIEQKLGIFDDVSE